MGQWLCGDGPPVDQGKWEARDILYSTSHRPEGPDLAMFSYPLSAHGNLRGLEMHKRMRVVFFYFVCV